ncbi:ribosome assembly cofactor RimP [Saccharicrinis fermentans]|uniref:Ribosome maturation factor RimP n=1 Tax=Saccharicrinis fermentans DSM 9555 = JCM 21142 TaxID=869213 RepID=W7Y6V7_9BACT|nr:ribosome assembly cofactor RimP [Saccharicrinis fermentans]GAF03992.1 ribosome maturation factor RimP [Saccharicrinis fermentans DSM 9555 = JCM 21142]
MITKEQILEIITQKIEADGCFIVEVKVSTANKITVLIDSMDGISIDYCIQISRLIESSFDREEEDFELEVSTPGLGQPLKVLDQYKKNIGREVEVTPFENAPFKGTLMEVNDADFLVKEEKKVKIEGKKKKELKVFNRNYKFDEVKSVKIIVSF